MTNEYRRPREQVPAEELPDDRFDGTDSGPGGTDTAYPPVDVEAAPSAPDDHSDEPHTADMSEVAEPRPTAPPSGPSDYETDGPDELADTPQR
jgi:hypothetical protein